MLVHAGTGTAPHAVATLADLLARTDGGLVTPYGVALADDAPDDGTVRERLAPLADELTRLGQDTHATLRVDSGLAPPSLARELRPR
ncbi:MAG: hypothetical protein R2695_19780 [Acidimicrobiales bacterium]